MSRREQINNARHPEFALRLNQACESNPHVPPKNYGQLQWLRDQLEKRFGVHVTNESIRKWLYGETLPRKKAMTALAAILGQDEAWLAVGASGVLPKKAAMLRDATADGAVNLVAGLARMGGASPAFPRDDSSADRRNHVDLHIIIQGAHYSCHVATFDRTEHGERNLTQGWTGSIPVESVDDAIVILAVCHVEDLTYRIFKLRPEDFDDISPKNGAYRIKIPVGAKGFREVKTFGALL